jgi:hypothetical protein
MDVKRPLEIESISSNCWSTCQRTVGVKSELSLVYAAKVSAQLLRTLYRITFLIRKFMA